MNIVLGITGSVAAVLTESLCESLISAGHAVRIVCTNSSQYFLPPGTADQIKLAIAGREDSTVEVFRDKDEWPTGGYHKNDSVKHIEFRNWADLLLIAPLSANTLAKIAHGICDNFLCCIARAWPKEKPVVLAPAMNTEMWIDPITEEHFTALRRRFQKLSIVDPESKLLACGDIGMGAMARIENIVQMVAGNSVKRPFRLLFIGDVIGPTGCAAVKALVPMLRRDLSLDAVIANAENSAEHGFGTTPEVARDLLSAVDFLTLGDHTFDLGELTPFLDEDARIISPANFERPIAGRDCGFFRAAGVRVGVVNLMGRVFMRTGVTSLRRAADQALQKFQAAGVAVIVVDMHAEATSEKQAMGWLLAGRVTAVLGTHTHTPTADLRVLPGGTAYVSDVGMAGASDGIIGFRKDFLGRPHEDTPVESPQPAVGPARLDAVLIEADPDSGRALSTERVTREI